MQELWTLHPGVVSKLCCVPPPFPFYLILLVSTSWWNFTGSKNLVNLNVFAYKKLIASLWPLWVQIHKYITTLGGEGEIGEMGQAWWCWSLRKSGMKLRSGICSPHRPQKQDINKTCQFLLRTPGPQISDRLDREGHLYQSDTGNKETVRPFEIVVCTPQFFHSPKYPTPQKKPQQNHRPRIGEGN